jgi:hypothetical protein
MIMMNDDFTLTIQRCYKHFKYTDIHVTPCNVYLLPYLGTLLGLLNKVNREIVFKDQQHLFTVIEYFMRSINTVSVERNWNVIT